MENVTSPWSPGVAMGKALPSIGRMNTYKFQYLATVAALALFVVVFFNHIYGKETAVCVFIAACSVLANLRCLRHEWFLDSLKRGIDSGKIQGDEK